jgi:hypothetical protein
MPYVPQQPSLASCLKQLHCLVDFQLPSCTGLLQQLMFVMPAGQGPTTKSCQCNALQVLLFHPLQLSHSLHLAANVAPVPGGHPNVTKRTQPALGTAL